MESVEVSVVHVFMEIVTSPHPTPSFLFIFKILGEKQKQTCFDAELRQVS